MIRALTRHCLLACTLASTLSLALSPGEKGVVGVSEDLEALLQTPICTGRTTPGATNWQQYNNGLYLDVDTSSCGFMVTPLYFTTLGGMTSHWVTTGATSIYMPTARGFRVYIYDPTAALTPDIANGRGWHINWEAVPNNRQDIDLCSGRTTPGTTNWQQYSTTGIYVDVNTTACGLSVVPEYFTSLGGMTSHWMTTGATSIYAPTATGFRIYINSLFGAITPAIANSYGWHINWHALGEGARRPDYCTGRTAPGATNWQQYGSTGLYVDVNTAGCGYPNMPLYFTSLGGNTSHWMTTGATAIYTPTPTGFRVYINSLFGPVSPALANSYGWHLNWSAWPWP